MNGAGRARTLALVVVALAAAGLMLARSWRIDYPYSIDFQTYWLAGSRIAAGEARHLYAPGGGPAQGTPIAMAANEFKNLPIVAAAFAPLGGLDYATAKRLFWWLSLAALLASAVLLGLSVLPPEFYGRPADRVAASIAFLCAFGPGHIALRHGQTTPLVLLAITVFLAASRAGLRRTAGGPTRGVALAGAALAAATLVKLPVLALPALEILRRRWRSAGTWMAVTAVVVIASLLWLGPGLHREYLHGLGMNAGTVITGHNNQSIAAFLARFAGARSLFDWTPRPLAPVPRLATAAIVLAFGAAAVAAALAGGRRARPAGSLPARDGLEHAAFLALGLIALPVAWDHYFLLLAPGVLLLASALEERALLTRPGVAALFAAAVLALAVPTPQVILDAFADRPDAPGWLGALLLTHYGLGALAVFGLALLGLGSRAAPPAAGGRSTA